MTANIGMRPMQLFRYAELGIAESSPPRGVGFQDEGGATYYGSASIRQRDVSGTALILNPPRS